MVIDPTYVPVTGHPRTTSSTRSPLSRHPDIPGLFPASPGEHLDEVRIVRLHHPLTTTFIAHRFGSDLTPRRIPIDCQRLRCEALVPILVSCNSDAHEAPPSTLPMCLDHKSHIPDSRSLSCPGHLHLPGLPRPGLRGDPSAATFVLPGPGQCSPRCRPRWSLFCASRGTSMYRCVLRRRRRVRQGAWRMRMLSARRSTRRSATARTWCSRPSPTIDLVTEVWHARQHSVILNPGELPIVDNRRTIHGRSAFQPQSEAVTASSCSCKCSRTTPTHASPASPDHRSSIIEPHGI